MTVCLTGDVHHMSMETRDQAYMDRTEVEAAIEYAEIAAEYDIPVTLFLTGKCAIEEPERVRRLAAMDNVEIGGHNYWAFTTPVHKGWRALEKVTGGLIGSWNGPRAFQSWEIRRTIAALQEFGVDVTSWRDHAYRHDGHTASLLADHGITHFSDALGPNEKIRRESGISVVPVNTPPDHEHIYHAFRTPEFSDNDEFEGPFGRRTVKPDEWCAWIRDTIVDNTNACEPATILAHPSCMWLADEFHSFEYLCDLISDFETVPMKSMSVQ